MQHSGYTAAFLGLLELAVPFYGLRLTRKFGTRQIGWALVAAFVALALLRAMGVNLGGIRSDADLGWTLLYALVPVLLLIGMAHVEALYQERKRVERAQSLAPSLGIARAQHRAHPPFDVMASVAAAAAQHFNRHLGVINVYAALLRHKSYDPKTSAHHQRIAEEAERATALGKLLLSAQGGSSPQRNAVSIRQLISQATPALRRSLGTEMRLEVRCRGQFPLVVADAAQIGFMLDQLVRNAQEASRPGATIALSAELTQVSAHHAQMHEGAQPGPCVCLTVSDTGCGMSQETRQHLFEPFFTTKDRMRHPGLGLPSVYGMVKKHCGWMEVESEPGRGTKVRIFFPVAE